MSRSDLSELRRELTDRDWAALRDAERYRLVTSKQLQRLHFDAAHPSPIAAARACSRTLSRLREHGILRALQRRIGGVRSGSGGFVWYLGPVGERLLQAASGDRMRGRRNYREPSQHFVDHTLAITELAVQIIEAERDGQLELLALHTEPASWQRSLSSFGVAQTLKPDLHLVTAAGEYEHHWFAEIDMATEHLPVIVRQCAAYQAFYATGRYQAEHGLFPLVVWVVPTAWRKTQIRSRIERERKLDAALFTVITADEIETLLGTGAADLGVGAQRTTP